MAYPPGWTIVVEHGLYCLVDMSISKYVSKASEN